MVTFPCTNKTTATHFSLLHIFFNKNSKHVTVTKLRWLFFLILEQSKMKSEKRNQTFTFLCRWNSVIIHFVFCPTSGRKNIVKTQEKANIIDEYSGSKSFMMKLILWTFQSTNMSNKKQIWVNNEFYLKFLWHWSPQFSQSSLRDCFEFWICFSGKRLKEIEV